MNKELIKALEAIKEAARVAQSVDGVDDAVCGKLDEVIYLVEDMKTDCCIATNGRQAGRICYSVATGQSRLSSTSLNTRLSKE
jgi:hypothetical protein